MLRALYTSLTRSQPHAGVGHVRTDKNPQTGIQVQQPFIMRAPNAIVPNDDGTARVEPTLGDSGRSRPLPKNINLSGFSARIASESSLPIPSVSDPSVTDVTNGTVGDWLRGEG